ncbi:PREDICTED: uncharacterized protein At4g26485-like [Tarenaya hassleriana]|uniref:uncharacterized protein At4g26485-like n=1 Tax=Tarenaya hassleriana TaxID=28532 RepID=UPI00053C151A|nr:PREDICTED: uncharacterized protein At4g26485-like [Tarenaya hassleriana]
MGEGTEKWIEHYSSKQKILLVGEGNFSFSLSLARAFGSAANVTATSLDSRGKLERDYGTEALTNIEELKGLGCTVMHGVNVRIMSRHVNLCSKRFDRIIFNFPHAGFDIIGKEYDSSTIKKHQGLVRGFLENARRMIDVDGEVHITHKTTDPFSRWDIEDLAEEESLCLVKKVPFYKWDYPGYVNKRGSGSKCNSTFLLILAINDYNNSLRTFILYILYPISEFNI